MVEGEVMMMKMTMISSKSPSRQGAETGTADPRTRVSMAAELGCVFRQKEFRPDVFRSSALSSPEGVASRWPRGEAAQGRGQGVTRAVGPPGACGPPPRLPS